MWSERCLVVNILSVDGTENLQQETKSNSFLNEHHENPIPSNVTCDGIHCFSHVSFP